MQRTYSNQNLSAIQYSSKNLIAKLRKDTFRHSLWNSFPSVAV